MPSIDWSAETAKPAGVYHAEIVSSVEKHGRDSKEAYFFATFKVANSDDFICTDILSFSPRAMNMTLAKLKALGFGKEKVNIEADELVGRRCWISVKAEDRDSYEPRLVIDIAAKDGFRCGYKPEASMPPAGPVTSQENLDDDIPF